MNGCPKFFHLTLTMAALVCLSACAKIDLSSGSSGSGGGGAAAPGKHPTFSGKRQLLTDPPGGGQSKAPPPPQNNSQPSNASVNVSGHWKLGFLFGKQNLTSTIDLTQEGTTFHGEGKDDQTNMSFKVEKGSISGSNVTFQKTYGDGKSVPVEYQGAFQVVDDPTYKGPYLHGEYQVTAKDKAPVTGEWEAEQSQEGGDNQPSEQETQSAPNSPSPNHAPQLSGKWNVGFEYNFKTVHSTMYLEQDGGKIIGHGIDENTKEKFVIEKGWYNFPKVTLVRKYGKSKNAPADRSMTFKATVTWVNDSDYQGPYLNGKTQGGGAWEAQLIK